MCYGPASTHISLYLCCLKLSPLAKLNYTLILAYLGSYVFIQLVLVLRDPQDHSLA